MYVQIKIFIRKWERKAIQKRIASRFGRRWQGAACLVVGGARREAGLEEMNLQRQR